MIFFVVFISTALLCRAHICLFEPRQRGLLSVAVPGDPTCFKRDGPCGGTKPGPPVATWVSDRFNYLYFQQNLNHWFAKSPGGFDFAIDPKNDGNWVTLMYFPDYPARDMVSRINMSTPIYVPPGITCETCTLRARYISMNPDEIDPKNNTDAIFYQCADVKIVTDESELPENHLSQGVDDVEELQSTGDDDNLAFSCCAPDQFSVEAIDSLGLGQIERHKIFYDMKRKWVRWDRALTVNSEMNFTYITTWTDYVNLKEYVQFGNEANAPCKLYGPDSAYPWCYGEKHHTGVFLGNNSFGSQTVMEFAAGRTQWSVFGDSCLPASRNINGLGRTFFNHQVGPPPEEVWHLPKNCLKSNIEEIKG